MRMQIAVITDVNLLPDARNVILRLYGKGITFPDDTSSGGELIKRTGKAEIVLVNPGTKLEEDYFVACSSLRHVIICGSSKVNIDLPAAESHGVEIHNIAHYGDDVTAETVTNRLMVLISSGQTTLQKLENVSMGIIGLGAVGTAIAERTQLSGVHVSYHGPRQKTSSNLEYRPLSALLSSSNVIVLCGPGNTKVLGQTEFETIKPGSIIVQISQGDIMDLDALKQWLLIDNNFVLLDAASGEKTRQALNNLPNALISSQHSGMNIKSQKVLGTKVVDTLKRLVA